MGIMDRVFSVGGADVLTTIKVLVHGLSGTGKTTMLAKSGKRPLIIAAERQALLPAKQANPNCEMLFVDTWGDLQEVFKALNEQARANHGKLPWDVIGLDSLSEMQRRLKDELIEQSRKGGGSGEKAATADGTLTMKGWGLLIDRSFNLVRAFRDLPVDFICICLSEETQPEEGTRYYRPSVSGKKLPGDLAGLFNAVFFSFTSTKNRLDKDAFKLGDLQYCLLTRGDSGEYLTKGHAALKSLEDADEIHTLLDRMRLWKPEDGKPAEYITSDQAQEIREKIGKAGVDEATYCKGMGVETVEETPATAYTKTVRGLDKKIKDAAK